jgi:pimeloyl-ACP methyl ester carboxylesterase
MDHYTRADLTFDVTDTGPAGGPAVILLHGFPEDRHCWDSLAGSLAEAGYRTLAPDQRGYSPGARPAGRRAYALDQLAGDVLALADAAGVDRFHVVGHDWGAAVAWFLAGAHSARIRSLTALSVPHPGAMAEALLRSAQPLRSWYMLFFQIPVVPERALSWSGGSRLGDQLQRTGLDGDSARRYARRAATPRALTGPLNWYRALPFDRRSRIGPVSVPTLFVWGRRDRFVTEVAANGCGRHVIGPFTFVPLAEADHWLPSSWAPLVAPPLLRHLGDEGNREPVDPPPPDGDVGDSGPVGPPEHDGDAGDREPVGPPQPDDDAGDRDPVGPPQPDA